MSKNKKQLKKYVENKILTPDNCRNDLNHLTTEKLRELNLSSEENIKIILLFKAERLDALFQQLPPIIPQSRSEFEKRANGEKISSQYIEQIVQYLFNGGDIKDEYITNICNDMKRIK